MKQTLRIILNIAAASVFTPLAIAKDLPEPKSAVPGQPVTLVQNAGGAGGLTFFEQAAQSADMDITARIRQGIAVRKNLSVHARNVKITTTRGQVVLKGVVITAEEKHLLGEIAIRVQRRENVDNRLTVGRPPSAPTGLRVVQ